MQIRSISGLLAIALLALPTAGEASFTYTGSTLIENFDGLPSGTTTLSTTIGQVQAISGTHFDGTKTAGTGTTFSIFTGTGTDNQGNLYNYGATGATDRALGTLASGGTIPAFGVSILNSSASALTSITLNFNTEQYRSSTSVANVITFAYGLSGGTATTSNYLTDASLAKNAAFNLVGGAPVTTNGALTPPTSTAVSGTITFAVPVAVGQTIFLRWTDTDDAGSDAGLAIDDFSLSATGVGSSAVPEPASALLLGFGLAGGGLAASRRRRAA